MLRVFLLLTFCVDMECLCLGASAWTDWSSCSGCGGTQRRTRECWGADQEDTRQCGMWYGYTYSWGSWQGGNCGYDCGDRQTYRMRRPNCQTTCGVRESCPATKFLSVQCKALRTCSGVTITSTNHTSGEVGKYANFDSSALTNLIGNGDWDNTVIMILKKGQSSPKFAKVADNVNWCGANCDGSAHLRWNSGAAAGDWSPGDSFYFLQGVTVQSTSHTSGQDGKYFNFLQSDLNKYVASDWDGKTIWIRRIGDDTPRKAMVWKNVNNCGSNCAGDANGRWYTRATAGDWVAGDKFYFVPNEDTSGTAGANWLVDDEKQDGQQESKPESVVVKNGTNTDVPPVGIALKGGTPLYYVLVPLLIAVFASTGIIGMVVRYQKNKNTGREELVEMDAAELNKA
eukprot:TRINITY_DN66089_c8_g9_i1.p1 TRINITY_DN66089_c8_g9~~TRINITY_DN66089_c8_g9_i1.p1  ORF type:complete len:399 (+),score=30.36 TRINITY_DN66089_c8_g9_i1:37-1233(+)